jgi:hypothetical protein
MRLTGLCVAAFSVLTLCALPSSAEILLNCRLMDRHHRLYEQYCLGDQDSFLIMGKCSEQAPCVIKKQNFKGAYYSVKNPAKRPAAELVGAVQAIGSEPGLSALGSELSASDSVRSLVDNSVRSVAGQ